VGVPKEMSPRSRCARAWPRRSATTRMPSTPTNSPRTLPTGLRRRRQAAGGPVAQKRGNYPGRRTARVGDAVGDLARRRREVKTLAVMAQIYADAGATVNRSPPTKTATGCSELRTVAAEPGRGIRAVRAALSQPQGRGHEADRCARHVLRVSRTDAIGRRGDEDDPAACGAAGRGRPCSISGRALQYQVDKRLEGAARARWRRALPMVYLTNRKPDRAMHGCGRTHRRSLRRVAASTAIAGAARPRAMSGRHDLALNIISNIAGARRSGCVPTSTGVTAVARGLRTDRTVLRRSLARLQTIERGGEGPTADSRGGGICARRGRTGLARFREKYAPLMSGDTTGWRSISPASGRRQQRRFAAIAKMAAGRRTLDGFIREMKGRFPTYRARHVRQRRYERAGPYRLLPGDRRAKAGRARPINGAFAYYRIPVSIPVENRNWRPCGSRPPGYSAALRGHHLLEPSGRLSFDAADRGRVVGMTANDWRSSSPC